MVDFSADSPLPSQPPEVTSTCSLSIMVARTDLPFLRHTLPHLIRSCRFNFLEKVLFIDTAPLSGEKVLRPGIGTLEDLRQCCQEFLKQQLVDRVAEIVYDPAIKTTIYRKHFARPVHPTHNYKGYPIFGTLFSLEATAGDYLLHFDSDMMFHQDPGYNWIEAGIQLLQSCPEVVAVRPLGGPPFEGIRQHQTQPDHLDPRGFYAFKFFSSRVYLIDRRRFEQLLPLPVVWRSFNNPLLDLLPSELKTLLAYGARRGCLDSWELMVSRRLDQGPWLRANLASPQAWTLHPKARDAAFIQALPQIIQRIEAGDYPPEQAGYYDLKPEYWIPSP